VDRLDIWLNAQRGWRRELLIWLWIGPPLGCLAASTWNLFESVAVDVLIAGLAVFALVVAGVRALMRIGSRQSRNGKWTPPAFSWRRYVAIYLISANLTVDVIFWQPPSPGWQHWHRIHGIAELICIVGFWVMLVAEFLYMRRLRQGSGGAVVRA
jgi:hypothetical protein